MRGQFEEGNEERNTNIISQLCGDPEESKEPVVVEGISETDEFVSCGDQIPDTEDADQQQEIQLDIDAINVDVTEKKDMKSVKAKDNGVKVPKLDLAMGMQKAAPATPKSSRRGKETQEIRLDTMVEADYEGDPMNVGHMATTNVSHDSGTVKEAEENFRNMLDQREEDSP